MENNVTSWTSPETLADISAGAFTAVPRTETKASIHPTAFHLDPKGNVLGSQGKHNKPARGSRTEHAKVCDPVLRSATAGTDLLPSNKKPSLQPHSQHLSAPLCPHILFGMPGLNAINDLCWATKPLKSVVQKSLSYSSQAGNSAWKWSLCCPCCSSHSHFLSHNTALLRPWQPGALYNKAHQVQQRELGKH